ncbi:hypothetical protein VTK73DRAFT_3868 [Phialemonium thermophilum]|uniref:Lysine-specific histone demethylase 1 n=1 Tax=Phialemonium thermophilum TaxID=223376 RepID=A0ABR3WWS8_9PEZI
MSASPWPRLRPGPGVKNTLAEEQTSRVHDLPSHVGLSNPLSGSSSASISALKLGPHGASMGPSSVFLEDIVPEIIVRTDSTDSVSDDVPGPSTPVPDTTEIASPPSAAPVLTQADSIAQDAHASAETSMSIVSDRSDTSSSDLSPVPSSLSSKATTPVDIDSSREPQPPPRRIRSLTLSKPRDSTKQRYNVRPKVSLPSELQPQEYAMQCIAAAESSRLSPYSLHEEEYLILRDHISHAQVTTYLNIRNGILRLWVRNPQIAVTREEAIGCAKDVRWFDVASVCFDWLVRRGYINFGCVEVKPSGSLLGEKPSARRKRKTVVVVGAGMAGLGCARQLEGLFTEYSKKFEEVGEEMPRVVVLEGRNRIGGRVYSRPFQTKPSSPPAQFEGSRFTAEMGGMIITGFERGNPLNILVRGQLGLAYHALRSDTTIYDSNGKPVDPVRDQLVEKLYNDCLDRVSEYKFKHPPSKLIEGKRDLIDEGRDSSAEVLRTIAHVEEAAAAQPHAPPVSELNIAPRVDLVPVSSDRVTGRVLVEPGTPGTLKASFKAKLMGWPLKAGALSDDIDLESATKEPGATLGSVTDSVISQYKEIVDLNAQDYRLINWHIANLEYSNATNYHQLSLQGWDIDAGYEWEGKHTMIIGGYQSVPRGLLHCPTPLTLRKSCPVSRIRYDPDGAGTATVECEGGYTIEADYIVNTIPLGVLKHGNVAFEPPLPAWKTGAIDRLGFGVLNKVVLVYKEAFWPQDRDIFGVLRNPPNRHSLNQKDYVSQRGRFFQWFNVSNTSGLPVLLALMAGDAGFDTEQACNDDLVEEATEVLRSVYGSTVPYPVEAVVTRWGSDKFARGSYSSAGPHMRIDDYDVMARPVGNLFFAGEHTTGTHPATVHGAYLSGLRAASEVLEAILGPIEVPTPLIIPKETAPASLKRKAVEVKDPAEARREAYEIALWDSIVAEIGLRPLKPPKPAASAYIFYSKANFEAARKRCEEGRRPGKGAKASANEVRVMSAKMWRDCSAEERQPYEEMAQQHKAAHAEALREFGEKAAEWDRRAGELKERYEKEHPFVPGPEDASSSTTTSQEGGSRGRRLRKRVESYVESDVSDVALSS